MKYNYKDKEYEILIIKKNNKNTYIRVNDKLQIVVTTNHLTPKFEIKELIKKNKEIIEKMIDKEENKQENFYYLGRRYHVIIRQDVRYPAIDSTVVLFKDEAQKEKWLKEQTEKVLEDRFFKMYCKMDEKIRYPKLKIRKMKTRWGVCNKKGYVTLNSELIKHSLEEIDYVAIHELCHYIYFDHSDKFWNLVGKYCPNYKKIREDLKD